MGQQQPQIYGLDIETDLARGGLDPAVAPLLRVALSGRSFDEVFIGDEATLLRALDARLRSLDPDRTLARGWSITRGPDGSVVRSPADVAAGDVLTTRVSSGELRSTVSGDG